MRSAALPVHRRPVCRQWPEGGDGTIRIITDDTVAVGGRKAKVDRELMCEAITSLSKAGWGSEKNIVVRKFKSCSAQPAP
jgi:hypothetical protein